MLKQRRSWKQLRGKFCRSNTQGACASPLGTVSLLTRLSYTLHNPHVLARCDDADLAHYIFCLEMSSHVLQAIVAWSRRAKRTAWQRVFHAGHQLDLAMQHTAAAPDTVLEAPQVTAPFNAGQACQDSMQIPAHPDRITPSQTANSSSQWCVTLWCSVSCQQQ